MPPTNQYSVELQQDQTKQPAIDQANKNSWKRSLTQSFKQNKKFQMLGIVLSFAVIGGLTTLFTHAATVTQSLSPVADTEIVSARGYSNGSNVASGLYRLVDDGTTFAATDNDSTYVETPVGVSRGSLTTGFSTTQTGVVSQVVTNIRAKETQSATGSARVYLYDGTTLIGTGPVHSLGSGYANYSDTFGKLSVTSANSLRAKVELSNSSRKGSARFTQVWLNVTYATISNSIPVVSIAVPAAGANVSGTVAVSGTASDPSSISKAEIQIDAGAWQLATGTTNWTYNWDTTGLSGVHTMTVRATSVNGVVGQNTTSVTIQNSTSANVVYGPGIGYDTKANINVGPDGQKVAIRFKASTTSALQSVRWVQRGGAVYSNGNGGTTTLSVQVDDGAGHPSGVSLGTGSITTGNPSGNWETYTPVNMSPAPTLTAGQIYYIVFTNPDVSNNISLNSVYTYTSTIPRQYVFADSDYGLMYTTGVWGAIEKGYTPVLDMAYVNGAHDGQAYFEAMIANYATISGASKMAREQFTVSGGDKKVTSASVRVRRSSGTSPLTLTLETVNPTTGLPIATVESVTVPSASIPVSAAGDDTGGAVWVTATFASPHALTSGSSYSLRLSTATDTVYTTFPIRDGFDNGFNSYAFVDGTGQSTIDGSKWADLYLYSHEDLQFYFR